MTQADPTTDRLLVGNCLNTLKTLADASIDSIVTDPPYELGFMGKAWDASGIAYQVQLWAECLRVLKPGGYLLAFGGTRTYHRMAVAIEDAGFEIRDSIHWTYGSGFPKSLNVSKAISKAAKAEREVVGVNKNVVRASKEAGGSDYGGFSKADATITAPATKAAKKWDGWGTALKPSHEPIVVARKPLDGTVAENVQQYGTGAINIDATRIGHKSETDRASATPQGKVTSNKAAGAAPDVDDAGRVELDRPDTSLGRFPANTLLTHNHDCQQTGTQTDQPSAGKRTATFGTQETQSGGNGSGGWESQPVTVATWTCTPNCPIELLDQQSGIRQAGAFPKNASVASGEHYEGGWKAVSNDERIDMGGGGASRFFHNSQWSQADDLTPFIYQAKPGKKERNAGLDGLPEKRPDERTETGMGTFEEKGVAKQSNFHPTVKPVELIRYLIKMVTPPKGTVLDPFLGSGTTAVAAILEGVEWKGCELTEDYLPIIKGRTAWATKEVKKQTKQPKQETLL
jgi:DNA modification methylase